jgi:hypothetical protein
MMFDFLIQIAPFVEYVLLTALQMGILFVAGLAVVMALFGRV